MGNRNRKKESRSAMQFHTDDPTVTITFSQKESAGVRAVIPDILTEAYRDRLQRASPYTKAG